MPKLSTRAGILGRDNAASLGSKCIFTKHTARKIFSSDEEGGLTLVNDVSETGTAQRGTESMHEDVSDFVHLSIQGALLKTVLITSHV